MRIECRRRERERGAWRDGVDHTCAVELDIARRCQWWLCSGGAKNRMRKRGKRPARSARMRFAPFFLLCIIGKRPSEKESLALRPRK